MSCTLELSVTYSLTCELEDPASVGLDDSGVELESSVGVGPISPGLEGPSSPALSSSVGSESSSD